MDDYEDDYKHAVEAGERNLHAIKLLNNWCQHAELTRSAGRGMIEEFTGLPIGHMGVQCRFSKRNSMLSWMLEDSAYDFYKNNCEKCEKRVPVGLPNILSFIEPRERAAERRKAELEEIKKEKEIRQLARKKERALLRYELSLEETFVIDLIDDLDKFDLESDDPRLEQLASLAPETFTRKIVEHLLPAILEEYLPYTTPAAKALLKAELKQSERIAVAVYLISSNVILPLAVDVVLEDAANLSDQDLRTALYRFSSIAVEIPPSMRVGVTEQRKIDTGPVRTLFEKRTVDICAEVGTLLSDSDPEKVRMALEIMLAIGSKQLFSKHNKGIFAKLMRRKILLPRERRDSSILFYLRKVASKCFKLFPEDTDNLIQSFLADNDDIGRQEAYKMYSSVLRFPYREKVQVDKPHKVAFKRLLWAATENPENNSNEAVQFFRHSWDEYAILAIEHFDELIGAAATLDEKYERISKESFLELPNNALHEMDKRNKLSAIDSLQGTFIEWAAMGAKSKGSDGVEEFLNLYRKLPESQTRMRGNMIKRVAKLLIGVESLTIVLSDWYRALMDENTLIRASAVQAWEDVPYTLVNDFPYLFFEAFSVLLSDPYVIVHKSAVRSLRFRSFPEDRSNLLKKRLFDLILVYSKEDKQDEFIVDCIDVFSVQCIQSEEIKGKFGHILSTILLSLEGNALYHAIDHLRYSFNDAPGFTKVAVKSIQDDFTRSVSIEDSASVILNSSINELQHCEEDIKQAFEALKPFRPEEFWEALLYGTTLAKLGSYESAMNCFNELIDSIPTEERNELWRLEATLVAQALNIEHAIKCGELCEELAQSWEQLMSDMEKENEERAKLRDFPPSIFY
ncbi:hypothetical protein LA983_001029 [Vibrio fluvialis]|nr:hypothetical protein [Vibrio fluvialis]